MVQRTPGPFPYHDVPGETIRAFADSPGTMATKVEQLAELIEEGHDGAVDAVEGEIEESVANAPAPTQQNARTLGRAGLFAAAVIRKFGGDVDTFDTTVNGINIRYGNGVTSARHNPDVVSGDLQMSDVRSGLRGRLQPEYDRAVDHLETDADAIASDLDGGPTAEAARRLILAGFMPLTAASAFPNLHLTDAQRYQAVRAQIANGTLPEFSQMTEEQRQRFLAENPSILPYLMRLDDSELTQQIREDVLALAVPHLDGADGDRAGQTVLDALDEDATPEEFARALGLVGQFGAYAKWAQQHGGLPLPSNRMDFLRSFYAKTDGKLDEIQDYIADDEHRVRAGTTTGYNPYTGPYTQTNYDHYGAFPDSQQAAGLRDLANGLLTLSDHRMGGGWDDLPESVRDAAQDRATSMSTMDGPYFFDNGDFKNLAGLLTHGDMAAGEGLSKELAVTVQQSTDNYEDQGFHWDDDLSSDVFRLVGRNHEASADLVGGLSDSMPEDYDQRGFLRTLVNHDWSDDGAGAAALTDWIHQEHADAGPDQQLANRAFNGLVDGLTSVGDDGIFRDLMGPDGESGMAANPYLAHSLVNATSDHLTGFSIQENRDGSSPVSEVDRVRLMTLLASDPDSAARLSAAVTAHQQDEIDAWAAKPDSIRPDLIQVGDHNARLSTYLDAALINEASERGLEAREAEQARVATIKAGLGIVTSVAGLGPTGTGAAAGVANSVLQNVISADHISNPSAALDPQWSAQGGHVTTTNGLQLVGALERAGLVGRDDLPPALLDPSGKEDSEITSGVTNVLNEVFADRPTLYSDFVREVQDSYDSDLDNLSVKGKGDSQITDFLESDTWPV